MANKEKRQRVGTLSKKDVVTLALRELDGDTQAIDTEDVAIAAHRRAPAAFGWRKHTEHIDLDMVRTSLRHEAESEDPRLAGSVRTGWHLTPAGIEWVSTHADQIKTAATPAITPAKVAARRAETGHSGSEIARVYSSSAFRAWASGHDVAVRDAAAVFRIDHYTSQRDRHLKTARLRQVVQDDQELAAFIDAMTPLAIAVQPPTGQPTGTAPSRAAASSSTQETGEPAP